MKATWKDANSNYGLNVLPDVVADKNAIINSLNNLMNCVPGQRSRTFQPLYGNWVKSLLHEPINESTSIKMAQYILSSISRWEPRIVVDTNNSFVIPDLSIPGYRVSITFSIPSLLEVQQLNFKVPV